MTQSVEERCVRACNADIDGAYSLPWGTVTELLGSATAAEQEREAANEDPVVPERSEPSSTPAGTALAMMVRRGFSPTVAALDLPFSTDLSERQYRAFDHALDRYAFRLFLRGAILQRGPFVPNDATRFLSPSAAHREAETLVSLGLGTLRVDGRLELFQSARSFGGTLEWYLARALRRHFGMDAVAGVKFHASGVGGDLDVIAAADGVLVCVELKSSPPKHLKEEEIGAFVARVRVLRPHIAIFAIDTALRISDKVVPMLSAAIQSGPFGGQPARQIIREVWALTPHVFVVNARPDLIANVGVALAQGHLALAPTAL